MAREYDEADRMVARLEYKLCRQRVEDLADVFTEAERCLLAATGRLDDARAHLEAMGEVPADV
ncbi:MULTISPECIES: hypothetical protein [unclassified Aeromicrobium]|uniref:hypothetical protein n=1 Tax=unclassified Aeromicrobium TaxID=2633570 RepID=UPI00288B4FCC|nr:MULTISPECIES: hypothetical protein [unclassified Aeromicrobium]